MCDKENGVETTGENARKEIKRALVERNTEEGIMKRLVENNTKKGLEESNTQKGPKDKSMEKDSNKGLTERNTGQASKEGPENQELDTQGVTQKEPSHQQAEVDKTNELLFETVYRNIMDSDDVNALVSNLKDLGDLCDGSEGYILSGVEYSLFDILLEAMKFPHLLKQEVFWCLAHILENTSHPVKLMEEYRLLPHLLEVLAVPRVRPLALRTLATIACINPACRQQLIMGDILDALYNLPLHDINPESLVHVADCVSNLCRDLPGNPVALYLLRILLRHRHVRVMWSACLGLLHYARGGDAQTLRPLVTHGIARLLAQLVAHETNEIAYMSQSVLEQIAAVDSLLSVTLICAMLPKLVEAWTKESGTSLLLCRILRHISTSRVTTSSAYVVNAVLNADVVPALSGVLQCHDAILNQEAGIALCSIMKHTIKFLPKALSKKIPECSGYLYYLLRSENSEVTDMCIEVLEAWYNATSRGKQPEVVAAINKCDVIQMLKAFANHQNADVKSNLQVIIDSLQ